MEEIQKGSATNSADKEDIVGYGAIFTNPKYRRATYIGLSLAISAQLTGVNIVYFDSNQIFKNSDLSPGTCTFLI